MEHGFVSPTADQLEADARRLPVHPAASTAASAAAEWPEVATSFGYAIRLPAEFTLLPVDASEDGDELRVTWQRDPLCSLSLSVHEGAGLFVAGWEIDGDAPQPEEEGVFSLPLAGRTGRIELVRADLPGQTLFLALATAAVADGLTVTVSVLAPSAAERDQLIGAAATVHRRD